MKVPIYTLHDLHKNEEYSYKEYHEFLEKVLEMELYENEIEEGVTKKALSDGTQILSEKQIYHLQNILDRNVKYCEFCNEKIDFSESIYDESDYCSYCQHQWDKD